MVMRWSFLGERVFKSDGGFLVGFGMGIRWPVFPPCKCSAWLSLLTLFA